MIAGWRELWRLPAWPFDATRHHSTASAEDAVRDSRQTPGPQDRKDLATIHNRVSPSGGD